MPGETAIIYCFHGDTAVYPVSNLNLEVGGVPVSVKAAVFKTLQVYVLLGTDVPELGRLSGVTPKNLEENGN